MEKFLIFIFFVFTTNVFATQNNYNKINIILNRVNKEKIYNNIKWLRLLHYKKHFFGYKSVVDDKTFFYSKEGKTNPQKELKETIKQFILSKEKGEKHPLCQFPARFQLLEQLKLLDKTYLNTIPKCKQFDEFHKEIKIDSLYIIFPTAYMNNPASMFGHTLLQFNSNKDIENNSRLNSVAINFGANINGEKNGIIYAFKGIFGLYFGNYSAVRYFEMTNIYTISESRDIWEYKLNYNQQQIDYLAKHIWELIHHKTKYYFFKKNCSYFILEILNILNEDNDLLKQFRLYTIPLDTIRILQKRKIITENATYRQSIKDEIFNIYNSFNKSQKQSILKYLDDKYNKKKLHNMTTEQLEIIGKILLNKQINKKITQKDYKKKLIEVLRELNKKQKKQQSNKIKSNFKISPDKGHLTGKIQINLGYSSKKGNFSEIIIKPAYHEIIDNNVGFIKNSQINFFSLYLKYFDNKIQLSKLDLINIKSLAEFDLIFKPLSFSVLISLDRIYDDKLDSLIDLSGGITLNLYNDKIYFYGLSGLKFLYNKHLDNKFIFGVNSVCGLLIVFDIFRMNFETKYNTFYKNKYNYINLTAEIDFNPLKNNKNLTLNLKLDKFIFNKKTIKNYYEFHEGIKIFY